MSGITAIYVRISSDPSGERAGVERQRDDCEKLAANLGLGSVRVYEDNDRSAYSGKPRPAFEELLTDVADRRVGTVVVWAIDRLYRRLADLERIVTVFDSAGVGVHAVKSGDIDLSTADGRLHARLLGSVAQHESEKKSERISARARQRATVEKRTTCNVRPFGWEFTDDGLRPHHLEGPALAAAYSDIVEGLSLRTSWKRLGKRVDIGRMAPATLGKILRNPRNAGLATYRGQIVGEAADGHRIVERDLFDRVAAILTDPTRRTSPGRPTNTWLGGGLLRCGKCDGPMSASIRHSGPADRSTKAAVYVCSRNQCMTRRRGLLDGRVLDMAGDVLIALAERGLLTQAADTDEDTHRLRTGIAAAEQRLDALAALLASGDLDPADYAKATAKVRAGISQDITALTARAKRPAVATLAAATDVAAEWAAVRESEDTETARAVLAELLDDIVAATDRSVTVRWAAWTGLAESVLPAPGPTVAGIETRREQVRALHDQGLNILRIAEAAGVTRATVRSDLKALGLYETART